MAAALFDSVSVKLLVGSENEVPEIRRLKLPLKDLTPSTLPSKLCSFLNIPASKEVTFQRWSDSVAAYVLLEPSNLAAYKQLYRAAKAKAKLRIKVTIKEKDLPSPIQIEHVSQEKEIPIIKAPSVTPSEISFSQTVFSIPPSNPTTVVKPVEPMKPTTAEPVTASPLKPWSGHLTSFTVQCNNCSVTIPDTHYHCDICENNDYDLCSKCVDDGIHCNVDSHFLIKRSVINGKLASSTTYKVGVSKPLPPRKKIVSSPAPVQPIFKESAPQVEATRTCNCCVNSYTENKFITCLDCEDYDLCYECFETDKHGHHPAHSFRAVDETNPQPFETARRLNPGRGLRHFATCDGCDETIVGVRHKCLNCPDWDYCTTCSLSARHIHPGHRFVPLYDHIGLGDSHKPLHNFVRCDGPLCKNKSSYIRGDRYKCAVCPDTDFCSSCEALPANDHCRTHPLIKLRTPVRNVSVTTFGEDGNGEIMSTMGDKPPQKASKSTETVAKSTNAATQVQTIAEIKPALSKVEVPAESPKPEVVEAASQPVSPLQEPRVHAHYVSDTLVDGTKVLPDKLYSQTWTLRNPGPHAWPMGCSVRFTGGDNMLNINTERPASTQDILKAVSSNTLDSAVGPNQEAQFTIMIRTPKKSGRCVSYWRLKTPNGLPFGHKLWCDIEVTEEPEVKEEVKEEIKTEEVKEEETKENLELEGSQMIFPKLEKESLESSLVSTPAEPTETTTEETPEDEEDAVLVDDLEHLDISDAESDDAFLTDEEYEMLDTDSVIEEATNGKN